MAKQTTFATPWEYHAPSGARRCLACGTLFTQDVCPPCVLTQRFQAVAARLDRAEYQIGS